MKQDDLTLEGMREGVGSSSVFVIILTENYLQNWFAQQAMLAAIVANKPIQIVLEMDARFHPFDLDRWQEAHIDSAICATLEENLPRAVTYRRRNYETDAMICELMRRTGISPPQRPTLPPLRNEAITRYYCCSPLVFSPPTLRHCRSLSELLGMTLEQSRCKWSRSQSPSQSQSQSQNRRQTLSESVWRRVPTPPPVAYP